MFPLVIPAYKPTFADLVLAGKLFVAVFFSFSTLPRDESFSKIVDAFDISLGLGLCIFHIRLQHLLKCILKPYFSETYRILC